MLTSFKHQIYTFILNIKAWRKVYNRMSTEAFPAMSYWPCSEVL